MSHEARGLLRYGGHAPGHLRKLLFALVVQDEGVVADTWDHRIPLDVDPLWWLCGQLDACTDVMPREYCDGLGYRRGTTYGVAARDIRKRMRDNDPEIAAGVAWRTSLRRRSTHTPVPPPIADAIVTAINKHVPSVPEPFDVEQVAIAIEDDLTARFSREEVIAWRPEGREFTTWLRTFLRGIARSSAAKRGWQRRREQSFGQLLEKAIARAEQNKRRLAETLRKEPPGAEEPCNDRPGAEQTE